jgi:hypothetical protein
LLLARAGRELPVGDVDNYDVEKRVMVESDERYLGFVANASIKEILKEAACCSGASKSLGTQIRLCPLQYGAANPLNLLPLRLNNGHSGLGAGYFGSWL